MMKVLLIGKTGQLGGDLIRNNPGHELFAPEKEALDICDNEAVCKVMDRTSPEVLINTAAFHNVPLCEIEVEKAFRVNCAAVRDLATACRERGARFVTFSSDYVFGGDKSSPYLEDDRPQPLQIYGISRLAGEFAALSAATMQAVVIRTCGLYGRSGAQSKGGNFVDKRVNDQKNFPTIEMGCDQTIAPTSTDDLSRAVWQLLAEPHLQPGIFHLVNEGACSWYEFTLAIYEILNLSCQVLPVDRGGMSGLMRRPAYSVLANTKARKYGVVLPHWKQGLQRYLLEKYGAVKRSPECQNG